MAIEPNSSFPQSFSGLDPLQKLNFVWGHRYYHYLPSSFDDSLDFYEQITNFIEYLNQTKRLTDDLVDQWEQIKAWIINDGLTDAVKAKLDEWLQSGVIAQVFGQTITNQIYDAIRAVASGSPAGVYANATALQTAYPNGDTHIYITADDGNWNYWSDGAWHKGGLYQAPKLDTDSVTGDNVKDDSLSSADIGSLNYDKIYATVSNDMKADMWYTDSAGTFLTIDKNNVVLDKKSTGDNGILIPVSLDNIGTPNQIKPLKIYADFAKLAGNTFTGTTDLYVLDETKNLKTPALDNSNANGDTLYGEISLQQYLSWNLSTHFYIMVAVHGGTGLLNVTSTTVNYASKKSLHEHLDDLNTIEQITGNGSSILPQYSLDSYTALQQATFDGDNADTVTLSPETYGFTISKNSPRDWSAIKIPVIYQVPISLTTPCYINLDFAVNNDTGYLKTELWLAGSNDSLHDIALVSTTDKAGHLSYKIEKALADNWNLNVDKYWKVCVLIYAKTASLTVSNLFVNYTGDTSTSIEKEQHFLNMGNQLSQLPFANENGVNSFIDYGLIKKFYNASLLDTLTVKSPTSIVFKKRNHDTFNGFYAPVNMPVDLDANNRLKIRVKFNISNDKNYSKIQMYLIDENNNLFSPQVVESVLKTGELCYVVDPPLVNAWNLNAVHFGIAIIISADEADLEISSFKANLSMTNFEGYQLADKTIASDNLLDQPNTGTAPFWQINASVWDTDSTKTNLISKINDPSAKFYSTDVTSHDKGFIFWLSDSILNAYPKGFYLNGRAKVSDGKLDLNVVDILGNYKGQLVDDPIVTQSSFKDFSAWCDTQKLKAILGTGFDGNGHFGILFTTHSSNPIYAEVDRITISSKAVLTSVTNSIENGILANQLNAKSYLGNENLTNDNVSVHNGLQYVGFNTSLSGKQKITKIKIYASSNEKINLIAASIDQHNLMVNPRNLFELNVTSGYNSFDLSKNNLTLSPDEKIFFQVSANNEMFTPEQNDHYSYLVIDNTNYVNENGYSGYAAYDDGKLYPFYAETVQIIDNTNDNSDNSTLESEIEALRKNYNPIIKRDDGTLQRLMQSNDNSLYWKKVVPDKIAVFGNSLTKEKGDIGMAASSASKDWYQLFMTNVAKFNPLVTANPRTNIAAWEQSETSDARLQVFNQQVKPVLTNDTGLVIYQLVDNVNSPARLATFEQDAETLISETHKAAPNALVYWIAGWFVDDNKMNLIKTACANQSATLVDITAFNSDPANKSYIGATRTGVDGTSWTITENGEAIHPGDKGMALIANKVIETLGL